MLQVLQMIVMLKRTKSNLSSVYAILPLDILVHELLVTLNTVVQALEMVLMLKRTNSNISYGYSNNTTSYILINNNKYYAYSSEMT